jgi:WD40 repeat protein
MVVSERTIPSVREKLVRVFTLVLFVVGLGGVRVGAQTATELSGHSDAVYDVAFSPDGRWMASGSYDRTVILWDLADRTIAATLQAHKDQVFRLSFSPDGQSLASCSGDGTVIIWDLESGQAQRVLTGHGDPIIDVAYSADGERVATAGSHIQLWKDGRQVWSTPHSHLFFSIAFAPDQQSLACGTQNRIRIFDVAGGESVADLVEDKGMVYQVQYSPDGRWLVSASSDGSVTVWDVDHRTPRTVASADNSALFAAAFSSDGKQVVTGGRERVIRVWDVPRLRLLAEHFGPVETVLAVRFSPDGKHIASGSYDGKIHLWSLDN